jgi:hypothetical protein
VIGSLAKRTMPIAIVPHYGQGDATKASRLLLADERVFEHGHATRAQTVIVVVTHAGPTDRLNDGSSAAEFGRSNVVSTDVACGGPAGPRGWTRRAGGPCLAVSWSGLSERLDAAITSTSTPPKREAERTEPTRRSTAVSSQAEPSWPPRLAVESIHSDNCRGPSPNPIFGLELGPRLGRYDPRQRQPKPGDPAV